jgi:signal transduction histidine kinase
VQRPTLRINEKEILNRIDHAYDQYMDSATNLITSLQKGDISRADKHQQNLQAVSQQLLNLGYELVSAHSDSMEQFLKQSRHSLTVFLRLFFGSLLFLIGALAWLAMIVYREMIMPLRMKLVETHAIIERQEKLASLGMLAAGVAHEIRNPLTAIKAWLFIQQKNLRSGTPEHSDAVLIGDEINRLERIVKDFLVFARPSDPEFSVVPADQPLLESSTLLRPQLAKSNIQLNIEPSPRAFIRVDAQQIKQVLLNLIQNSAESIAPTGGTINLRVRLDSMRLGERLREVVILEVSDTGKGIAPDIEKRLFDPFFTTKESGTGLGLSIAARIVEKHGGALQYQTQVNRGTVFGIVLPRATP